MTDPRISDLPPVSTLTNGALLPVVEGGVTSRLTAPNLAKYTDFHHRIFNILDYGAIGDDTFDNLGVLNALHAAANAGDVVYFPAGIYRISDTWAISKTLELIFAPAQAILHHVGIGAALSITAPYGFNIRNAYIRGGGTTTFGLYLGTAHHGFYQNIRVAEASTAALALVTSHSNTFINFRCSAAETIFGVSPLYGIQLDGSLGNTFENVILNGMQLRGLRLINTSMKNTFLGGTCDNMSVGLECQAGSNQNLFSGLRCEVTSIDVYLEGSYNSLVSLFASQNAQLLSGASHNVFVSGAFKTITIDSGASDNAFLNINYAVTAGGVFTDNGLRTLKLAAFNAQTGLTDSSTLNAGLSLDNSPAIMHMHAIEGLADNGTAALLHAVGTPNDTIGIVLIVTSDALSAIYNIEGFAHATLEISDPAAIFTPVSGTAGMYNIYWSGANNRYEVENKRGGARTLYIFEFMYKP